MSSIYRQRFIAVVRAPAVGPACVIMGLTMIAFSLPFLIVAGPSFFVTPSYRNMASLGGSRAWGTLFLLAGGWRVCAACFWSYGHRKLSTSFAIFLWCLLLFLRIQIEPWHPGVPVLAVWSMTETWTLFRLQRTARHLYSPHL